MPVRIGLAALCLVLALPAHGVDRVETATRLAEDIPPIPDALWSDLNRYQNTRMALPAGWLADGRGQFILTRFAATTQVHWVQAPGAARQQLSFFEEPIALAASNPKQAGFLFGRDVGGSEFWQLFWYDLESRSSRLLTDGKSRNERPLWNHAGDRIAFSTTRRNGRDSDIHLVGLDGKSSVPVLERDGSWYPAAFSPDDGELLVFQYRSINDVRPHLLDLATRDLTPLSSPDRPISVGGLDFALDGNAIVYTSDEEGEFRRLRLRDRASGEVRTISADIDWDVENFAVAHDGRRIAFVTNEDGWFTLHLRDLATGKALPLPELPRGIIRLAGFSPDDAELAFSLNSATQPGDLWSLRLADGELSRWTTSEIGGLDPETFVEPELVRYPTFDEVDGQPRTIPAFYYRPRHSPEGTRHPVVINIHGGPESQALPGFNPDLQYLVNELGVAVLVPNVRGSRGYGKSYLKLDNGELREDSVRDIGALLDWIATRPELDASRVGVAGGSYGGYMVLASLATYPKRIRAGIDVVGISNFVTFLENTQDYRRHLRRAEYGDESDPRMRKLLERISPTRNAHRIKSPLFVAQGANDPRVPASESEQIVRTVRDNEGTVWYLLFKDEGHGFRKKPNRDYYGAAAMLFWQTHLLDSPSP